ncbi:MAG: hypothetical protein ITG07_17390 [Candidimonas sp.]|nr:hypothetical protein [Candidimonas sp.]
MPTFLIDGNWFDMATLAVAAFYAFSRAMFAGHWRVESFVVELSYGVSIFPLVLLTATVASSTAINTLMTGNKIIISLAGLISLIVILKRTFERTERAERGRFF